jgi:hypothetical protein
MELASFRDKTRNFTVSTENTKACCREARGKTRIKHATQGETCHASDVGDDSKVPAAADQHQVIAHIPSLWTVFGGRVSDGGLARMGSELP